MEHLHPEDARTQLLGISRALRRGGVYLCVTPNRLTTPHDVSRGFDDVATGFHLREYTNGELVDLLRNSGFARVNIYSSIFGIVFLVPAWALLALERWLLRQPKLRTRMLMRFRLPRKLIDNCRLVAFKA